VLFTSCKMVYKQIKIIASSECENLCFLNEKKLEIVICEENI